MTSVFAHLKHYHPDWELNLRALRGKHSVGNGWCKGIWHDHSEQPNEKDFDRVEKLLWYENYNSYTDCPNTKVTNCLREVFKLEPITDLLRYKVNVGIGAKRSAQLYYASIGADVAEGYPTERWKVVCLHYQGNTSPDKKNLRHWQAAKLCEMIRAAGRIPVLFDWDKRSELPHQKLCVCPDVDHALWHRTGTGDAEVVCALIAHAEAFVGIDSGPGKCASATDTPSLICWVKHHPMQFHDLSDTTTHLIPQNHRDLSPLQGKPEIAKWFTEHYAYRCYRDDEDLVTQAQDWLKATLKWTEPEIIRTPVVDTRPPKVCINISYCCQHFKGDYGKNQQDGVTHAEWLLRAVNYYSQFGYPIVVSCTGFPGLIHLPYNERRVMWEVQRVVKVLQGCHDNPGHQKGAGACILQGIDACVAFGYEYMIHTAEDIIPRKGVIEHMVRELESGADYYADPWGVDGCEINTQFFACRPGAMYAFDPYGHIGPGMHLERYMRKVMEEKRRSVNAGPEPLYQTTNDYDLWQRDMGKL